MEMSDSANEFLKFSVRQSLIIFSIIDFDGLALNKCSLNRRLDFCTLLKLAEDSPSILQIKLPTHISSLSIYGPQPLHIVMEELVDLPRL